jgi:hypothetical protein
MNFGNNQFPFFLTLADVTDATIPGQPGPLIRDQFGAMWVRTYGKSLDVGGVYNSFGSLRGSVDGVALTPGGIGANTPALLSAGALIYGARSSNLNVMDRLQAESDNADALGTANTGHLATVAHNIVFNSVSWDRVRSASAAVQSGANALGVQAVALLGNWSINNVPAAATQATISRAAGAAGVRHVCTSIDATLIIPPTVNQPAIQLNLRDGATGAGAILWSRRFGVGAAVVDALVQTVSISGLSIPGSAATAMTLEFSAAGAATTLQSVSLTGYDTQ